MNLINTLYETAVDLYTETTYRYREGRNTVPNRLDFDTQKLIDCGAIVICKGMNGDPESPDYKKHLDDGSTNLITLYNIKHAIKNNPDSWILEAIKHPITIAPIGWKDMSLETYDGKYNQILWSLKKLGIPYKEMLKHNSLNETVIDLHELRGGLYRELRKELPDVPEWVFNDLYYTTARFNPEMMDPNHPKYEYMQGLKKMKWKFFPDLHITMDKLDSESRHNIGPRIKGATLFDGDKERHEKQLELLKSGSKKPLIMVMSNTEKGKLEMWEGWHRLIQLFVMNPDGFDYPVYIGIR